MFKKLLRLVFEKKEVPYYPISLQRIREIENRFAAGRFSASEAADTVDILCKELRRLIEERNKNDSNYE